MTAVTVRRAGVEDLDEAARLFQAYLDFYQRPEAGPAPRRFIAERLERGDSTILLAFADASAVGFIQLYPSFASLSMAPNWILNDLYVDPDARGGGVGEALMRAARELALEAGAAEIFLQTARDNEQAQRLYRRMGYERDDHFLVYALSLDP